MSRTLPLLIALIVAPSSRELDFKARQNKKELGIGLRPRAKKSAFRFSLFRFPLPTRNFPQPFLNRKFYQTPFCRKISFFLTAFLLGLNLPILSFPVESESAKKTSVSQSTMRLQEMLRCEFAKHNGSSSFRAEQCFKWEQIFSLPCAENSSLKLKHDCNTLWNLINGSLRLLVLKYIFTSMSFWLKYAAVRITLTETVTPSSVFTEFENIWNFCPFNKTQHCTGVVPLNRGWSN